MNHDGKMPRLLIFSNSCMVQNDSNGRTLRNFLIGWDKSCIAQFYIQNQVPDFDVCENYYCVTDSQALHAFLKGGPAGGRGREVVETAEVSEASQPKKRKRNAFTMLLRNFIWRSKRWRGKAFDAWIDSFSPQVVLLQAGDSPFMLHLAVKTAKKYKVPLIVYNSEVYCFKKFDYFKATGFAHFLYPVFRRVLLRQYRRLLRYATMSVYICEEIEKLYQATFGSPSKTIYTASQIKSLPFENNGDSLVVSYLGNLGVGRHRSLIEIAEALRAINPAWRLNVYGIIPDDEVKQAFEACAGIAYRGFVSYQEVLEIMGKSDLLIHTENFEAFYRKDSQYAFSTKIADSLSSGRAFLLYAPKEMACAVYLKENAAAHVATTKGELQSLLRSIAYDSAERDKYIPSALALARKNHNAEVNSAAFQQIIIDAVKSIG